MYLMASIALLREGLVRNIFGRLLPASWINSIRFQLCKNCEFHQGISSKRLAETAKANIVFASTTNTGFVSFGQRKVLTR